MGEHKKNKNCVYAEETLFPKGINALLDSIFKKCCTDEDRIKLQLLNKQSQDNYEKYIRELKKNKDFICRIENLKCFLKKKMAATRLDEEDLTLYLGKLVAYQTVLSYVERYFTFCE